LKKIKKYFKSGDEKLMQFDFDFIGLQYYFRIVAKYNLLPHILFAKEVPVLERNMKRNSLGMEIYHKGLYKMIKKFSKYEGIDAIYITEAGVCLDDEMINGKVKDPKRIKYMKKTFSKTLKSIRKECKSCGFYGLWLIILNGQKDTNQDLV
jgi:beta-glucosidase